MKLGGKINTSPGYVSDITGMNPLSGGVGGGRRRANSKKLKK